MAQPSRLQKFLDKIPQDRRLEIERQIRLAPTTKAAFDILKSFQYPYSYDSVKTWRLNQAKGRVEQVQRSADVIASIALRSELAADPIKGAMDLSVRLNSLCDSLVTLLQNHSWVEDGELKLNSRDALKLLSVLPGLCRASSGVLIDMHRVNDALDRKAVVTATIEELKEDWRKSLEADNPELVPLLETVSAITLARLDADQLSLLERCVNQS
jgi:hypothetical protein